MCPNKLYNSNPEIAQYSSFDRNELNSKPYNITTLKHYDKVLHLCNSFPTFAPTINRIIYALILFR